MSTKTTPRNGNAAANEPGVANLEHTAPDQLIDAGALATGRAGSFLRTHGPKLLENGYNLVPIAPGGKFPKLKGWSRMKTDQADLQKLLQSGHADAGIGIHTRLTPAVDLDIRDPEMAEAMAAYCLASVGSAPCRVGQAPKAALIYRTDSPFGKLSSKVFIDDHGRENQVEILGEGQQVVAYHIHPETRRPYEWDQELTDTPWSGLTPITADQAKGIISEFERHAVAAGWTAKVGGKKGPDDQLQSSAANDDSDIAGFINYAPPVSMTSGQIIALLNDLDPNMGYDDWRTVGMALYHQFDGDFEGLELWSDWSADGSTYPGHDELEAKWRSFEVDLEQTRPVTMATVIMMAKAARSERKRLVKEEQLEAIRLAREESDLRGPVARAIREESLLEGLDRELITKHFQQRLKEICGVKPPIREVRKLLQGDAALGPEVLDAPWCHGWVLVQVNDKLYHTQEKRWVSRQGFDMEYSRQLITPEMEAEGRCKPLVSPLTIALNKVKIPVVQEVRYVPGQPAVFYTGGRAYANSFDEHSLLAVDPGLTETTMTAAEREHLFRFQRHFEVLMPDAREREIVLSWFAHKVRHPEVKIGWAVVMQGVEGTGKTWLASALGACLGEVNTKTINSQVLQRPFTSWADGGLVGVVEEVKMHGHNRFDVLNHLKPFITNPNVMIERKGEDPRVVPNFCDYFLLTNHKDALPLDDKDRRYFVTFNPFQRKSQLEDFLKGEPDYFDKLFHALAQSPHVFKWWLLNLDLSPEFQAGGRAPGSQAKQALIELGKSEHDLALEEYLESNSHPAISRRVVSSTLLKTLLKSDAMDAGQKPPGAATVGRLLVRLGFVQLGRVQHQGERHHLWSAEDDFIALSLDAQKAEAIRLLERQRKDFDGFDDEEERLQSD